MGRIALVPARVKPGHQIQDMLAKRDILGREHMPAQERELTLLDTRLPVLKELLVLRKRAPRVADRRDAKPDQGRDTFRGVTHEASVKAPRLRGLPERIGL